MRHILKGVILPIYENRLVAEPANIPEIPKGANPPFFGKKLPASP